MIPRLHIDSSLSTTVCDFLTALASAGFSGDIETSYSSRLAVATDNSIYQQLPQAVLHPKSTEDVVLIGTTCSQNKFQEIAFSARGGGTGTNGQALTTGIVVDLSRHMNKVLQINSKERWIRVQAGIIKDQLNDAVQPYGLFFAPELSTSNRATLGGMINTDASGQGSLKYGKTSDHVLSLRAVFVDGSTLESGASAAPEAGTSAAAALATAEAVCRENRQLILEKFPDLNRFLTGYDLKNAYDEQKNAFHFTRILCGSEGTLAFITEATLKLTPLPKFRALVNVKYDSFDAALRNAPFMVKADALSVETIDSKVLGLAKKDNSWHEITTLLTDVPEQEMLGINIVEFAGDKKAEIDSLITGLCENLDTLIAAGHSGILGYQICTNLEDINRIYTMRKKAVGLLGAVEGQQKPIAFVEDTCVPPENLADFIAEFRALLDARSLYYGMFGHVDSGVLHVRPALDMCDPAQEMMLQEISDAVVQLVMKYKGLMWGEHGRGFRSEYGPEFFGEALFNEMRRVKTACDPFNTMNPGKICTPLGSDAALAHVSGEKRGHFDRQIPLEVRKSFTQAMDCNGNGLCFTYDTSSPMCPSMKGTADRRYSPKGRAGLIREWLRLLGEEGIDILEIEREALSSSFSLKNTVKKHFNSRETNRTSDFSHEVYTAMETCLACKVCASQCPVKVDVPRFRARFLNLYHTRYQRPFKDYLVANIETLLPLMNKAPALVNLAITSRWVKAVTKAAVGYLDAPVLSTPCLQETLRRKNIPSFNTKELASLSHKARQEYVCIVQDPFTTYYDAEIVRDCILFVQHLGKTPILLPFTPNGKAQHSKGFLKEFKATAQSTADFLNEIAQFQIPLVGVEPASVLCYRDEYREALGEKRGDFEVLSVHEWLHPRLGEFEKSVEHRSDAPWYLFSHCTEKTALPAMEREWVEIFAHFGETLIPTPVGCCGMAGTFGHEAEKFTISKNIYALSWQKQLATLPKERCLVNGYSCRSQVKRFENFQPKHPLQALLLEKMS